MSVLLPARRSMFGFLLLSVLLVFSARQSPAEAGDRAWVGIDIVDIATAELRKLGTISGVLVLLVREDSPASSAGLMGGDVIVQVDGQPIATADELICAIMMRLPGTVARLATIRGTEGRSVIVTLGTWPDALVLLPPHCPTPLARTSLNSRVGVALQ